MTGRVGFAAENFTIDLQSGFAKAQQVFPKGFQGGSFGSPRHSFKVIPDGTDKFGIARLYDEAVANAGFLEIEVEEGPPGEDAKS